MAAVEEVTSDAVLFDSDGNILSSGTTLSGTTITDGGSMIVADKGTAEETTVSSGGQMTVSSGGVANSTTVNYSGYMFISSGGVANSTTLAGNYYDDRAYMFISSGGVANSTTVSSGGYMYISSGGSAADLTLKAGGQLGNFSFGEDLFIDDIADGSAVIAENILISEDTIHVSSGGVANSTTVNSRGYMYIENGGVANSTTVSSGGHMNIENGGTANSTTLAGGYYHYNDGAYMYISSGGVANSTTVNSGGYMYISNGGVANSTTVNSRGYMYIENGGVANSTTVDDYGFMYISSGGVADSTTVDWGNLYISSGGVANNTTVENYGAMYISSGGVANNTTVNYSGYMYISNGGVANSTTVNDGNMYISSGGVANSTTVNSSGYMYIENGGSATDLTLKTGGVLGGFSFGEEKYFDEISDGSAVISENVFILGNDMIISSGGVANSTMVNSYGRMYVYDSGVANNTTVNSGGDMYISSGGTATDIVVSFGGRLGITVASDTYIQGITEGSAFEMKDAVLNEYTINGGWVVVSSGGVANSTTVNSNGYMFISSGGTATDIVVSSGGRLGITVASDTYIQGITEGSAFEMKDAVLNEYTINGGWVVVSSGGVANSTTVNADGDMYIENGGVANSTTVNDGNMHISSGGVANSTTVDWGNLYISSGGVANSTTVDDYGSMYISSGGTATDIVVSSGGHLGITVASETYIQGTSKGSAFEMKDAALNGYTISNGWVIVSSGGVANSTMVSGYGATMHISSGGVANSTTVAWGHMFISSGGVANNTTVDGCYMDIYGGVANSTTVNYGGEMHISSGGVANSTMVFDGFIDIYSGGVANNTTVNPYGYMSIENGGVANSTTVNSWGSMHISSGGVANNTTVNPYGYMDIYGGVANSTTVDGGYMYISNGGVANSTTVNYGGEMHISYGGQMCVCDSGVANSTTVNEGGCMYIFSGGVANSTTVDGGSMYISSGGVANSTMVNAGSMVISDGGVANSTTVSSGGKIYVSNGGVANSTTVNSGGSMLISSGGVANSVTVNLAGGVQIDRGGSAASLVLHAGGKLGGFSFAEERVFDEIIDGSAAIAENVFIRGNKMQIFSGGVANSTTVNRYGSMHISSGGVANSTTVNNDYGAMHISSGGVANSTTVSRGDMYIFSGGVANSTIVSSGYMRISSGGVANSVTVNLAGEVQIDRGGSAASLVLRAGGKLGGFSFAEERVFDEIIDGSAAIAENVFIRGNEMHISNGGVADSTTVNSGGYMYIENGGVANSTTLAGTDYSRGYITYYSGGYMYISSGGVANSTTVSSGGNMTIFEGGVASDTTVTSGGSMFVSSGGVHRGGLQIASGAVVSAYEGSTIDFTLTDRTPEDTYLINDLSLIQGAPTYTITVSADQAAGTYKLAQGADSFTGTITIGTETETYGTLTVNGEAFIHNEKKYTLTQNGEDLQLFISPLDSEAPVCGKITLKQTDQNSVKVTISGFTDNVKIARYDVYVGGKKVGSTTGTTYTYKSSANLTAGSKTFAVKAIDTAGNISTSAGAKLTVNLAVVGKATSKSTVLTWKAASVSGGLKQYEVVVSGKKYISTTNKITIKGLAVGSRSVTVYARSKTNKLTKLDSGDIIKVTDGTAPTGGKVVVAQSGQKNIKVTISGFKDNVKVTKYYVYVNGKKVATTTSTSHTYKSSVNLIGKKTIAVKALDAAGNISASKSVAITIKDVTAPSKVTGLKVSGTPTQASAKLVWTKGVDNVGVTKYAVKVSGVTKTYTTTTNALTVKGLTAGKHTYQVYAYDATGRKSVVSTAYSFNVKDITAPTGGKITLKQASQNSVKITISSFKDNVKVGKYYVYLNGKKIATTTSTTYTYTQSANFTTSKLTFAVKAVDTTGNISAAKSAAFAAKVRVSGKATNLSTVLTWTKPAISGTLKRYEITVGGKKYTSTTNKITIKGLAIGTRSVTIKAINTSNQSKTVCSGELIKVVAATVNKTISGITDGVKDVNGITGSAANDIVTFQKDRDFNLLSDISLGSGDDKLIIPTADDCPGIAFENGAGIDFGAGNDMLDLGADASLGYCDRMCNKGAVPSSTFVAGFLNFGTGNDTFRMRESSECDAKSISFGDGNDVFQLDDDALFDFPGPGTVAFGAGNDKMILGNDVNLGVYESTLTLDFGSGTDTMTFDGKVHIHADQLLITGLENITGSGSLVLVDGCALDDETKAKFEQAGITVTLA